MCARDVWLPVSAFVLVSISIRAYFSHSLTLPMLHLDFVVVARQEFQFGISYQAQCSVSPYENAIRFTNTVLASVHSQCTLIIDHLITHQQHHTKYYEPIFLLIRFELKPQNSPFAQRAHLKKNKREK